MTEIRGVDTTGTALTTGDVALELRTSRDTVIRLADSGRLPPTGRTASGWRLFSPETVEQFRRDRARREAADE